MAEIMTGKKELYFRTDREKKNKKERKQFYTETMTLENTLLNERGL